MERPLYRCPKINNEVRSYYGSNNNKKSELPRVKGQVRSRLDRLLDSALHDKGVNKGKSAFNPFELYCAETLVNLGSDPKAVSIKIKF